MPRTYSKRERTIGFWLAIILVGYLVLSVTKAMVTVDDCKTVSAGQKHWVVFPPKWSCKSGGVTIIE